MFGKKKYRKEKKIQPFQGKRSYMKNLNPETEFIDEYQLNNPEQTPSAYLSIHASYAVISPANAIPGGAYNATRYQEKGFEKVTSFKKGKWDGYTNLGRFSKEQAFQFPLGLLPKVMQAFESSGIRVIEKDSTRIKPDAEIQPLKGYSLGGGIQLRDYQIKSVDAFVELDKYEKISGIPSMGSIPLSDAAKFNSEVGALTRYRVPGTGLLWSATGSGKSYVAASIIARLGVKTLFMVYGNDLVRQAWRTFNHSLGTWLLEHGHSVGITVEGDFSPRFITVASSSTLAAMVSGQERVLKSTKTTVRQFLRYMEPAIERTKTKKMQKILMDIQKFMAQWITYIPGRTSIARNVISKIEELDFLSIKFKENYVCPPGCGNKTGLTTDAWLDKLDTCLRHMNAFFGKFNRAKERKKQVVEYLESIELLIVDECHKGASSGAYAVSQMCSAFYKCGLSGTPLDRSDGANIKVIAAFGEVAVRIKNAQMRTAGVIPDAKIRIISVPGRVVGLPKKYLWTDLYNAGIVNNEWRNKKGINSVRRVYDAGGKILVLFLAVQHGKILGELLEESGIPHKVLDGNSKTQERRDTLDRFSAGTRRVIVASRIFGTGIDIPDGFDLLLLMGGGKGKIGDERGGIAVLQNLGRGLRGEGQIEVIDFMDEQHRTLYKHSSGRLEIYQEQGCFEVTKEKDYLLDSL